MCVHISGATWFRTANHKQCEECNHKIGSWALMVKGDCLHTEKIDKISKHIEDNGS